MRARLASSVMAGVLSATVVGAVRLDWVAGPWTVFDTAFVWDAVSVSGGLLGGLAVWLLMPGRRATVQRWTASLLALLVVGWALPRAGLSLADATFREGSWAQGASETPDGYRERTLALWRGRTLPAQAGFAALAWHPLMPTACRQAVLDESVARAAVEAGDVTDSLEFWRSCAERGCVRTASGLAGSLALEGSAGCRHQLHEWADLLSLGGDAGAGALMGASRSARVALALGSQPRVAVLADGRRDARELDSVEAAARLIADTWHAHQQDCRELGREPDVAVIVWQGTGEVAPLRRALAALAVPDAAWELVE